MSFYWIKTNVVFKKIFSNYVWDIPNCDKKIHLSFDDGPTPEITEWVLGELKKHNAKATFFCVGKNIEAYPGIFARIIREGHAIGNHTFNHQNGWKTKTVDYLESVRLCEETMRKFDFFKSKVKIFRPPYGKIKPSQTNKLREFGYKIIMWDVLSADFDQDIIPRKCFENVFKNTVPGSIIVFHDSVKGFKNLQYTLPKALVCFKEKGFVFDVIK